MTKKYTEMMEHVTLDEDTKNRILKNISETDLNKVQPVKERKSMHWKPAVLLAGACAAVLVFISVPKNASSVSGNDENEETLLVSGTNAYDSAEQSDNNSAYAASNPFISCDTLEELEEAAGFSILEPVFSVAPFSTTYQLYDSQAYIVYEVNDEMVTLTAENKPLSDNEWTYSRKAEKDGMEVMLEGYEENNWQGAKYEINGIYYELTVSSPTDEKTFLTIIPSVK